MTRIATLALLFGCALAVPASAAMKPGDKAPDFTAQAAVGGEEFTFSLANALTHTDLSMANRIWARPGVTINPGYLYKSLVGPLTGVPARRISRSRTSPRGSSRSWWC